MSCPAFDSNPCLCFCTLSLSHDHCLLRCSKLHVPLAQALGIRQIRSLYHFDRCDMHLVRLLYIVCIPWIHSVILSLLSPNTLVHQHRVSQVARMDGQCRRRDGVGDSQPEEDAGMPVHRVSGTWSSRKRSCSHTLGTVAHTDSGRDMGGP